MRAIAIVDGEHYPDVVREALHELPYEFVGVMLIGGTEKLRGEPDYGVPIVEEPGDAEIVVDLSDEPVLTPELRLALASRFLALGLPYVGADFRFDPPTFHPFELPSIAVIGTGKRVGKTAVTGHVARLLARDRDVVVVAMGRGGPAEPELIETPPTVADLVALSRSGRHAASDHLETAALARVPTIGCRRAGGGMAGAPFASNVLEGARLAASLEPDVVVFDGSGAAIPPIATSARILVAHDRSGLNAYRALISDLVLTPGEDFTLRLRPVEPLTRPRRRLHDRASPRPSISRRTSCTSRATSRGATCSRTSSERRGRHVSRRDQGGRDRRRRRACARARRPRRARRQRGRRAWPRRARYSRSFRRR